MKIDNKTYLYQMETKTINNKLKSFLWYQT